MRVQEMKIGAQTQLVPFYQRTLYSTWALATGDTSFKPFNNVEAVSLRNYNKGQNIFNSNQGRLLALRANIFGPSYAQPVLQASGASYAFTVADEWAKILNQATFQVSQDSEITHQGMLSDLVLNLPQPILTNTGTPLAAVVNDDGSPNIRNARKRGVYWTPPIMVAQGRTLEFDVSLPSGVTVNALLNTHILQFILTVEEIPQSNLQKVRT